MTLQPLILQTINPFLSTMEQLNSCRAEILIARMSEKFLISSTEGGKTIANMGNLTTTVMTEEMDETEGKTSRRSRPNRLITLKKASAHLYQVNSGFKLKKLFPVSNDTACYSKDNQSADVRAIWMSGVLWIHSGQTCRLVLLLLFCCFPPALHQALGKQQFWRWRFVTVNTESFYFESIWFFLRLEMSGMSECHHRRSWDLLLLLWSNAKSFRGACESTNTSQLWWAVWEVQESQLSSQVSFGCSTALSTWKHPWLFCPQMSGVMPSGTL